MAKNTDPSKPFDPKARKALFIVAGFFVLVILLIGFGRSSVELGEIEYHRWFEAFSQSPWRFPIVIGTFIAASFLGLPQWALIAGAVVAFGPSRGAAYAWVATLCSASVNFWLGRFVGASRLQTYAGERIKKIINAVKHNGFVASFAVRLVPTGPFVLVNMAAGVSGMPYAHFLSGTALGIIPKIAVVGFIAVGVVSGSQGKMVTFGFVAIAVLIVLAVGFGRKRLRRTLGED